MMFENFINLHWLVSCLFFAGIFSNSIVFWLKDLCVWIFFLVIYFIVLIVIIARTIGISESFLAAPDQKKVRRRSRKISQNDSLI